MRKTFDLIYLWMIFFQQNVCNKSHVVTIEGRKIGIIGYVTPDTKFISKPGLKEKCPQLKEQK
jgi:2',3'-cyclic-nucleotide 2'-phosphodiesterase (5'-nucleotidase family)